VWQDSREQEAGLLHLWLEKPEEKSVRRGAGRNEYPTHPYAGKPDEIRAVLEELLGAPLEAALPPGEMPLFLPTRVGLPMPSHLLDGPGDTVTGWRVPTLWMTAGQASRQLSTLLQQRANTNEAYASPDLLVWAAVCRWVMALLARERLVPIMEHPNHDAKTATLRWVPVLDDAQDAQRMKQLVDAMPPSARAYDYEVRSATDTIKGFVSTAVDSLARRWVSEIFGRLPKQIHGWPQGSVQWLTAVYEGRTQVGGVANELSRLAKDLQAWSDGLMTPMGRGFRTCFRLHAPHRLSDDWKVQIILQGADDPTLLMEAEDLWRPMKGQRQLIEASQEQLLADLGRALKVFPELERCLRQALPSAVTLSTEEAAEFLQRTAWLLEESGFGVQIPGWAKGQTTPWSVQLTVSEPGGGQESKIGLNNLLNYRWEVAIGDETLNADEFLAMADSKVPLVQVRGQWVLLDRSRIDQAIKLLEGGRNTPMTLGDALRTAANLEGGLTTQIKFAGTLGSLNGEESMAELPAPQGFQGTLRPYQLRGYSWLWFLRQRGLGACLADDMGLGKTIQLIAMMLLSQEKGVKDGPALLVCPTSVLGNWGREIARFGPTLQVMVHHGAGRRQGQTFQDAASKQDLVITTYALVARDMATLGNVDWSGVILDEAQNIKNPEAQQAKAVRRLKACYRVALTGTPVENRLTDLWSVMEFLNPGLLGSQESFKRRFASNIERYQNADTVNRLRTLVQPFILRRLKTDARIIQDLPEKQEMKTYCPLTREQASLYQATVRNMLSKVEDAQGIQRRGLILQSMLRLKQICNHPTLFLDDNSEVGRRSGKLARLQEMLEEILANSDRALIFTQFARMGHMLTRHLTEEFGCDVLFLHGGVPQKERDKLVARFQGADGPPFLVLSLKAGGVGLNLTNASHVFHFDRWWNPAVEDQATDRAFRIGQKKNVQVHKFICSGTLEEAIDTLIESKVQLARNVVGGGEDWLTELSNDQLRQLLSLREEDVEEAV
jgi:SNF2 family DNA or RNA helicase